MNSMPFLISWISIEYLQWEKMGPTQQREDLNLQFIAFLLSPSNRHRPSFLPLVIPMEQAETNNIWSEAELSRDDDSKDLVFWARSLLLSGQMLAGVREFKGWWRLDYKTEVVKKTDLPLFYKKCFFLVQILLILSSDFSFVASSFKLGLLFTLNLFNRQMPDAGQCHGYIYSLAWRCL